MTCWDGGGGCLNFFPLQCIDCFSYEDLFIDLGFNHYNLKVQNNSPIQTEKNQLRNHTCRFEKRKENEINPSTAKYKKEGAKASDRLSEEPTRFTTTIPPMSPSRIILAEFSAK